MELKELRPKSNGVNPLTEGGDQAKDEVRGERKFTASSTRKSRKSSNKFVETAEDIIEEIKNTNFLSFDKIFWYCALVLAAIGMVVYPVRPDIPQLIWDIFFLAITLAGLYLTWNYAFMVALGESATELRKTFLRLAKQNDIYKENVKEAKEESERLAASNDRIKESTDKFSNALDILGETIEGENGFKAVTKKYDEMLTRGKRMVKQRAKLAKEEAQLEYQQEVARQKRRFELITNYARDLFNEADVDNSNSISAGEVPQLQARLFETLHIAVDFSNEIQEEGDLKRYVMIEKMRDMAEKRLDSKKKAIEQRYEQKVQEIERKVFAATDEPLGDEVLKYMAPDSKEDINKLRPPPSTFNEGKHPRNSGVRDPSSSRGKSRGPVDPDVPIDL